VGARRAAAPGTQPSTPRASSDAAVGGPRPPPPAVAPLPPFTRGAREERLAHA
jgi:hypothetical protein